MTGTQSAAKMPDKAGHALPFDDADLTRVVPLEPADATFYDIRYCLDRRYFQMQLIGVWDSDIFARFSAAYLDIMAELAAKGGVTHAMVDASAYGIQPAEVAEGFPVLVGSAPHRDDQRTACVVPALVNRIQARPGGDLINARYFRTVEDACDWLFSDEA